jgi:rubrerythrin
MKERQITHYVGDTAGGHQDGQQAAEQVRTAHRHGSILHEHFWRKGDDHNHARADIRWRCSGCHHEFVHNGGPTRCPECGGLVLNRAAE